MNSRAGRRKLQRLPVLLMAATHLLVPSAVYADQSASALSLWRAVERRILTDDTEQDEAIKSAKAAARDAVAAANSRYCRPEPYVHRQDMTLSKFVSPTKPVWVVRSASAGDRYSLQSGYVSDYRISMRSPWFSLGGDRGLALSAARSVTRIENPSRYENDYWSATQQLRSGHSQGEATIEHEITVWERQGPCPPGIGPGFVTDEDLKKAVRDAPSDDASTR